MRKTWRMARRDKPYNGSFGGEAPRLALAAALCCVLATPVVGVADDADLAGKGLLSVATFGALPDDGKDDTAAIQRAVDQARDKGLVVFFPPGVYELSDTISAAQRTLWDEQRNRWMATRDKPNSLLGSSRGRAVLRLADEAKGFDDPASPKPLVWIWAEPRNHKVSGQTRNLADPTPGDEQPNISFDQVFKGIDIDLRAKGNRGAVGIRHAGSQGSMLEDVTIHASGAYAGVINPPGQGGGAYNLRVEGGRFGIVGERRARFPVLAGLELFDQDEASLVWDGQSNITIAGFHFRRAGSGVAIRLQGLSKAYNSAIALIDGVIDNPKGALIDERGGGNIYLRNVWYRAGGLLAGDAKAGEATPQAAWRLVQEYADGRRVRSPLLVNGTPRKDALRDEAATQAEPDITALLARHAPPRRAPSFEDPDVVDATAFGARPDDGKDDSAALEAALRTGKKVFLPKGVYHLTRTLTLPADSVLFGVAKHLSVITPDRAWRAGPGEALISTVDDADATTVLASLRLELPNRQAHTALLWRAGSDSIVRDIMVGPSREKGERGNRQQGSAERRHTFRIEGQGGGRWYGPAAEWNVIRFATAGPTYRHLSVAGTRQALRMYGLNIERSLAEPQAEIVDARDVEIYYLKSEPQEERGNLVLEVRGSDGIAVYGYSGISNERGGSIFRVGESSVTLVNLQPLRPSAQFAVVEDGTGESATRLDGTAPVVMYRRSR